MPAPSRGGRAGLVRPARAAITAWALLGGLVLVAVVLINVLSVIGGVVWRPFPGDFEMTEIGIAVAAFAFLPYCQNRKSTRLKSSHQCATPMAASAWKKKNKQN